MLHQACTLPGGSTPFGVTSHRFISARHREGPGKDGKEVEQSPWYKLNCSVIATGLRIAILAEGARALSVTLSGGALFAS